MGRPLYEAVPDDVNITKLTIGQRDALARYKRHENINTFLGNESTPKLIAGGVLLASIPTILRLIFEALKKQDVDVDTSVIDYLTFQKDLLEGFFELTGAGKFDGDPFEGEAKDFWDKYVKK